MEVTITRISRKDKTSRAGRPFVSVGIQTKEHAERWISLFGNKDNVSWKVGDTVEILVEEKNGYLNGSMPTVVKHDASEAIVVRLENFITFKLEPMIVKFQAAIDRLETLGGLAAEKDDFPFPDFGENDNTK